MKKIRKDFHYMGQYKDTEFIVRIEGKGPSGIY